MSPSLHSESATPTSPSAQFLTSDAAAVLLATPRRTIEHWCRTGRLPAVRPGRAWLIPAEVVAELRERAIARGATHREAGAA